MLTVTASYAQMTVSVGTSNVDVKVKRCFAQGNDVCLDLIFTGNERWEFIDISQASTLYDDDGNMYKGGFDSNSKWGILFEYDNSVKGYCQLMVPKDIPRKVRLRIADVDEYASSFVQISLLCTGNSINTNSFAVSIKNLPIAKD